MSQQEFGKISKACFFARKQTEENMSPCKKAAKYTHSCNGSENTFGLVPTFGFEDRLRFLHSFRDCVYGLCPCFRKRFF